MANGRPRWTFGPTPNGCWPPETSGQLKLLQRVSCREDTTSVQNDDGTTIWAASWIRGKKIFLGWLLQTFWWLIIIIRFILIIYICVNFPIWIFPIKFVNSPLEIVYIGGSKGGVPGARPPTGPNSIVLAHILI